MKAYFFLLGLFIPGGIFAQHTADSILRRSASSIKKLKSINYNIYAEEPGNTISADVFINRVKPYQVFEISQVKLKGIEMTNNDSRQIAFASDGTKFEFIDPKTNEVVRIDSPTINKIARSGMISYGMLPMPCYIQAEPFENILKNLKSVENSGDTVVFGVNTIRLKVTTEFSNDMGTHVSDVFWFIGKTDGLVRGMQSKYSRMFLKIKSTDASYTDADFSISATSPVKKITGMEPVSEGMLKIGMTAPDWTLASNKGDSIRLSHLRGKIVVLDFWGTWCVPCIRAMPDIQAIYDRFKNQAVEIIGVSVETESKTDPAGFVKKKGFTYPIALNGRLITKDYKVSVFPSLYIIDKDGKIIYAEHSGTRENFRPDIIDRISKALSN